MPVIHYSKYKRPFYLPNRHFETLVPSLTRRPRGVVYNREKIDISDGDFLNLDWAKGGHDRLMVFSHGLEGDSRSTYALGMVKAFQKHNWDVLAWNCRSCGGEMNRNFRLYHHGNSDDLAEVIDYVLEKYPAYEQIVLVGASMGGAINIKYLGEQGKAVSPKIIASVGFSVPAHLPHSVDTMHMKGNSIYRRFFLKNLSKKMKAKAEQFPGRLDLTGIDQIDNLYVFADRFSGPMYGFDSGEAFYQSATALPHLPGIAVPALVVNAWNDPMLHDLCYPEDIAAKHDHLYLELLEHGGHVGFSRYGGGLNWAERRALGFVADVMGDYAIG
jgi:predicted alpha/beta-fold hydrolase